MTETKTVVTETTTKEAEVSIPVQIGSDAEKGLQSPHDAKVVEKTVTIEKP